MKKIIFVIFSFVFVNCCYSQEIGIAPTKLWSDNYEFQNPIGYSIYFYQPLGKIGVKVEYVSAKNNRNYFGLLIGGFLINPEDYITDNISSKTYFHAVELSVQVPCVFEVFQNFLNIGAGVSFDKFSRDKTGLNSGKTYNTFENKFGLFYLISLSRQGILGLPLRIEILFKHKGMMKGNYATDSEQPFVSRMDIKELQFNLGYVF